MRNLFFALMILISAAVAQADETTTRYKITDLVANSGQKFKYLSAKAINNKGEIVGVADKRAYLWRSGKFHFIGKLPGSEVCEPVEVNDKAQVVGTCSFAHTDRGSFWPPMRYFFWQDGRIKDLGAVPILFGSISINNNGQVALIGSRGTSIYENGRSKVLGSWLASGINDNGQIIGAAFVAAKSKKVEPFDRLWAVIWQNGSTVSLGKNRSAALLLNNKRNIVLSEDDGDNETKDERLFLLKDGAEISLKSPGEHLFLKAINDGCQIVGWMYAQSGRAFAAMWQEGTWFDLNDLAVGASGWNLKTAYDINERGQIVGIGNFRGQTRGFLLTPL